MNDGGKATRYCKQIRIPAYRFAIDLRTDAFQAMPRTFGRKRNGIVVDGKTAARTGRCWPRVENGNNLRSGFCKKQRGLVGIIIVGCDDNLLAGDYAETPHISAYGLRQHHAGAVVVRESHRALDASGRKNDLPGPHVPQPLRDTMRRNLSRLRNTLRQCDQIMIPIA